MENEKYKHIVSHYENCFKQFGDSHKGVDWPNFDDLLRRYQVMLEVVKKDENVSLLDFGCGTAMLKDYIDATPEWKAKNITYSGIDLGETYIEHCKKKYPETDFKLVDVLKNPEALQKVDYIVMNGIFTEKLSLTFDEMFSYFEKLITVVFEKCNKGIAFNVMSKAVDWERDDLFHLSTDLLINFLTKKITRNFVIRNDYGLYEYTVYVYKN